MNSEYFSVGEFSKITGLSIKTLRFYHEKGILVPTRVDESTGYRYYDDAAAERARVIRWLRDMEFSLDDIAQVLKEVGDEADIIDRLEMQKLRIAQRMRREREIIRALDGVIASEREARERVQSASLEVEDKAVGAALFAGVRFRGKYSDCGQEFARLARKAGRFISGKPFCLYFDAEYKDEDADIEACFPIRREFKADGIQTRTLPEQRCLVLLHRGPYAQLGRSYQKLLRNAEQRGLQPALPVREVYHKGPGLIFRGNPINYLTEIQLPVT
jgi:DNA-binding transcriptional MerR regulator